MPATIGVLLRLLRCGLCAGSIASLARGAAADDPADFEAAVVEAITRYRAARNEALAGIEATLAALIEAPTPPARR